MWLSAARLPGTEGVRLVWRNPPDGYDAIGVLFHSSSRIENNPEHRETIGGNEESYTLKTEAGDRLAGLIKVVGYRDHVPSNATTIRVWRARQIEAAEIPFTSNVMPNWRMWTLNEVPNEIVLEEVSEIKRTTTWGHVSGEPAIADDIAYYQSVAVGGSDARGGIYRKYLGLTPGNAYRVAARVNTWAMDEATQEWSYSFHACPGYPDGRDFTPEQFAGLEPLPDGSEGPEAACVVSYGPGETTNGEWVEVSTVDEDAPGKTAGDIVLPEGVTEIVLWIRHTGTDTTGVGFDWSSLEDLSVTGGGM